MLGNQYYPQTQVLQTGAYPAATSTIQQSQIQNSQVRSPVKSRVVEEELQASQSQTRVKYLRVMYLLLFLQLLLATLLCNFVSNNSGFASWVDTNYGFTFWTCLVILVVIQLVALFSRQSISQVPQNIVFYVIHAISFAFVFSYLEIQREENNYLTYGLLFYTIVILALLIHVVFARNEITFQSVALYIFGGVYLMTLLFVIFTDVSNMVLYIIAILSVLWGFYIVWENESVVGSSSNWSREDYFSGAIAVYMYIFILILKLVELIKSLIIKARP